MADICRIREVTGMDFKPMELHPGAGFKDAVLSAAEARKVQMISTAQQESTRQLNEARRHCEEADPAQVNARYAGETRRRQSASTQAARKDLLARRAQLVDEMFGEIERRLSDFAQSEAYPAWLAARLAGYAAVLSKGDAGDIVVWLRKADAPHQTAAEKALPGCRVALNESIALGGAKIQAARRLYDETLDAALRREREQFYENSGLLV
jgi:vacuolar-type H+-ATPase subunit E/Vma4